MSKASKGKTVLLQRVCSIFDRVNEYTDKTYWQPLTPVMCDLVCLQVAGWHTLDYETLLAVSGYGSSFAYKPLGVGSLNDYAFCYPPVGREERLRDAIGAVWEHVPYKTPETAWKMLKKTLDAGKPVRIAWMEDAILAGYQEPPDKKDRKAFVMCEPFAKPGKWWSWDEFADWFRNCGGMGMARLKKKVKKAPARKSALDVLKTFVKMAKNDPRGKLSGFADVRTGLAGIAAYADDIAEGIEIGGGWRGCHCAYPQISGRPSAAAYLSKLGRSKTLGKGASERVLAAGSHYAGAAAAWYQWGEYLGHAGPKNGWTSKKHRLAGSLAVCAALKHEILAIDAIERALRIRG